jgi:tetratricopeptide (TPR) repeat protein
MESALKPLDENPVSQELGVHLCLHATFWNMYSKKCVLRKRPLFALFSLVAVWFLAGCRTSQLAKGSDAITLMAKYNNEGRYDDAIAVAQDWLKKHPEDPSQNARFYEQIAITYLFKASKDKEHRQDWVKQAVAYYDEDLAVHQKSEIDVELYVVGRGFELAGDLSTYDSCLYYGRAIKAFEEEVPFIQGDSYTAYGKTVPLAPVRKGNEQALERVTAKLAKAGCK